MKLSYVIAGIAALIVAASAYGQDLKPVKDKSSKLFGYQDKSKNWVIPPAYFNAKNFKDGLAEVIVKPEKTKYHGIIDATGRVVIPPVCRTVSVYKKEKLIMAERESAPGSGWLWGVYDYEGNEIWAPQFTYAPSFYDGRGIARSADNGLKGVIDVLGNMLVPFENLAVERSYGGYEVLTKDFVRRVYDSRMNGTSEFAYPGYVIPYDPEGDPVRAAAWHIGVIGYRLYSNNLRLVQMAPGRWTTSATCAMLPIDWGDGRFVRLEPVEDTQEHPGSMEEPISGKLYTVAAILYEPDGRPVREISKWGWIEADFEEGVVYNSEGKETWMVMRDINCPAIPSFSTPLTHYHAINNDNVFNGLGIHSYELESMYDPERFSDQAVKIITGENAGITYRLPPEVPTLKMSRAINELHRTPLFRQRFRLGDIVNCKVKPVDGGVELELADGLVCHYEDRFHEPSFSMREEEPLFWGPYNEYSVVLSARQAPNGPEFTKDDVYGSGGSVEFALELYDGFDRYLQTIEIVPFIDFIGDGWMVLEGAGIALRLHGLDRRSADVRPDGGARPDGGVRTNSDHRAGDRRNGDVRPSGDVRPGQRPGDARPDGRPVRDDRVKITAPRLAPTLSALNAAYSR